MNKKNPPDNFTGLWVYECPSGTIYEIEYLEGVEHGKYRNIHPAGVVMREGGKCYGLDHGIVIIRNSAGIELDSYQFVHGTGTHLIYNSAGTIGWEIPYLDGNQHGTKRHFINGVIVSEQDYFHGKEI